MASFHIHIQYKKTENGNESIVGIDGYVDGSQYATGTYIDSESTVQPLLVILIHVIALCLVMDMATVQMFTSMS